MASCAGVDGEGFAVMTRAQGEKKWDSAAGPVRWSGIGGSSIAETGSEHFRVDDPRIDRNGGHARWKFLGQRLGQAFNGVFRGAVGSDFRRCGLAPTGAKVGDHAGAAFNHGRDEMANDIGDADDIDSDDLVKFFGGYF